MLNDPEESWSADEAAHIRQLFEKETRWLYDQRDSPHIVQIYDTGTYEDRPYFTMALADTTLFAIRVRNANMTPIDALYMARRATETLGSAMHDLHEAGKTHRDIKPGNILVAYESSLRPEDPDMLLSQDARLWLADLGLAADLKSPPSDHAGTPAYMPPDNQTPEPSLRLIKDDLFAASRVVYFCLFGHDQIFAWENALRELQIPDVLSTTLQRCLHVDPGRWHDNAAAWRTSLLEGIDEAIDQVRGDMRAADQYRRIQSVLAVFGVVAMAALLVFAGAFLLSDGELTMPFLSTDRPAESGADGDEGSESGADGDEGSESGAEPEGPRTEDQDDTNFDIDAVRAEVEEILDGTGLTAAAVLALDPGYMQVILEGSAVDNPGIVPLAKERLLRLDAVQDVRTQNIQIRHSIERGTDLGVLTKHRNISFSDYTAGVVPGSTTAVALVDIAELMEDYPEIDEIEVAGFTDAYGGWERNVVVSQTRAQFAADFLIDQGVPRTKIRVTGYGERCPVGDPNSEQNRRVQIIVLATAELPDNGTTAC